jgi:HEAT repeat protein
VEPATSECVACGESLDAPATYERKLLRALGHVLPDRRVIAARILGEIRSTEAVPRLAELAERRGDPYLAAVAAEALAKIEPDHPSLRRLARGGPVLVRAALGGRQWW